MENPFLLSFSDLMAGLLAIFILVLIVTLIELERRKEELRVSKNELIESLEDIQRIQNRVAASLKDVSQREAVLTNMLREIQKDLAQQGIRVVIAENERVLRIPEHELHFDIGKYKIPPDHAETANAIGRALLNALRNPDHRGLLDTVFVEGHTDSIPNRQEMGNWGLSTYRAISLWYFWTENPGQIAELKDLRTKPPAASEAPKPLFSVSGYADTRSTHGPLAGKGLKDDRPEDRRIDIRFTLVSSEEQDLMGLQENLNKMRQKTKAILDKLKGINHVP